MIHTIGNRISAILQKIEKILWEFEINEGTKPEYSEEGFIAATKIFMSALIDKTWELQTKEKMSIEDRLKMVEQAGIDLRKIVKTYTNINTHKFYEEK